MSMCRWRRHGCIKSYPLTKILWKKIWKIDNIPGMLWQLHKSKYIRFKNIHFSFKKKFSVQHCQLQILWSDDEIIFNYPWEKKIQELTVSSRWPLDEPTVSSPWPKCSPWQFVFSWDFHTGLVLHASSFVPFGTDLDHLVKKAICH